jgi:hypothetical protein
VLPHQLASARGDWKSSGLACMRVVTATSSSLTVVRGSKHVLRV